MRIIYQNDGGGVSVVIPAPKTVERLLKVEGSTELQVVDVIGRKDVPAGTDYMIVKDDEIPNDRTFRDAWVKDDVGIKVDLPKAKIIAHAKRRIHRDEIMKPLDIKATIPMYAEQAEIDRQTERDSNASIQVSMNSATTIDELKQLLP